MICRQLQLLLGAVTLLLVVQQSQQQSGKYIAEGYFVLDRQYLNLYMREAGNNWANAKKAAIYDLNFFLYGVNQFYDTLKPYGLDLDLRIRAVQILTYTIFQKSTMIGGAFDGSRGISDFGRFLKGSNAILASKDYDFAVLISGYKMTGNSAGMAAVKTMCTNDALAVVEGSGTWMQVRVMSHEIGHIFGSWHDPASAYTIMTPTQRASYDLSQYKFSALTAKYIKGYLKDAWAVACLKSTSPLSKDPYVTPQTYTGKAQSAVTTCQRAVNPASSVCTSVSYYGGAIVGDKICRIISCRNMNNKKTCIETIPTEGMPCAWGSSCRQGQCVSDVRPATTKATASCLWGDDKYGNCASYTKVLPGQGCGTDKYVYSTCCGTCSKYKTNLKGCPYGDVFSVNVNGKITTCAKTAATYGVKNMCGTNLKSRCCKTCYGK